MKVVNYKTSTILGRLAICIGFVITGISLILASIFLEASFIRKFFSVIGGVLGIIVFGRLGLMVLILLFKDKEMFRYDQESIIVKNRKLNLNNIRKVEVENEIPTGYLGIKTPAFILNTHDREKIFIHTYYCISKKDYPVINRTLKDIVSDRTKR
ncbi:hypothetical protein AM500_05280 [Bacillus sp. FJAT-18017]|uniref:DUF5381 family protein n=1 Tax=Bacillus sp. FJAT-18017 TaxID=1705566 RepID=UPI0006AF02DB|nr:DUF5381 family protein [Bacillus sp. FJAT-18017]ALC89262.1 hypothetical protein AM500_05280 [Bacillus sp. FJAT-18017]